MVKRKVDVINENERLSNNGYARIAKALRPAEPSNPGDSSTGSSIKEAAASSTLDNTSTGQRFGETTDFLPLTQVSGEDEDEEAANAIQGTQGGDDSSLASTVLYGLYWCRLGFLLTPHTNRLRQALYLEKSWVCASTEAMPTPKNGSFSSGSLPINMIAMPFAWIMSWARRSATFREKWLPNWHHTWFVILNPLKHKDG
jgi:hypothetical protein